MQPIIQQMTHQLDLAQRWSLGLAPPLQIAWLTVPIGGALIVWYGLLVVVVATGTILPQAVIVMFPTDAFMSTLPDDVAILDVSPVSISLSSDTQDLAQRLYEAGAWVVLPTDLASCLSR